MRRSEPVLPGVWRDNTRYPQVTHIEHVARNDGVSGEWPGWTTSHLVERLADRGITQPWSHQAEAADLARSGRDVIIATGTASGKSLAFLMPAVEAVDSGGTGTGGAPGRQQLRPVLLDERPVVELRGLRHDLRLELCARDHAGVEDEVHAHRRAAHGTRRQPVHGEQPTHLDVQAQLKFGVTVI